MRGTRRARTRRRTAREREAEKDGRLPTSAACIATDVRTRMYFVLRTSFVWAAARVESQSRPAPVASSCRRAGGHASEPQPNSSCLAPSTSSDGSCIIHGSCIMAHGQAGRPGGGGGGRLLWGPRQAACREEAARGGKRETASETAWMVTGGGSLASPHGSPGPPGALAAGSWRPPPAEPRPLPAHCRRPHRPGRDASTARRRPASRGAVHRDAARLRRLGTFLSYSYSYAAAAPEAA